MNPQVIRLGQTVFFLQGILFRDAVMLKGFPFCLLSLGFLIFDHLISCRKKNLILSKHARDFFFFLGKNIERKEKEPSAPPVFLLHSRAKIHF